MVSQNPDRRVAVPTNTDTAANNNNFFGAIAETTGRFAGKISAVLGAFKAAENAASIADANAELNNPTSAVLLNTVTGIKKIVASNKVAAKLEENKNLTVVAHVYPDGKRVAVNFQPANNTAHHGANPNTQKAAPVVVNVSSYGQQPNGQSPANNPNYGNQRAA